MKVLFLTDWYPTSDRIANGIFVREHAKAARTAGVDVTVLHIPSQGDSGRRLWAMTQERDENLTEGFATYRVGHRSIRLPGRLRRLSTALSYPLYIWSVVRACRRLRASGYRPDLIHAHVFSAGVPAVVVGKLTGTPVVITEHYTAFPERTLSRSAVRMAHFAFGRSAAVLPVCLFLQKGIEAYGIHCRFEIVPNAVDAAVFHPAEGPMGGDGPKRLLFVGALEPTEQKGFPTLLAALALLGELRSDWRLDVVGDGPLRTDYERRVAESPVSAAIAFRGMLTKSDLAELMRHSDVFVLPSRIENLPCVVIEAMASGLPVVSTTVGGIPEMVSELEGILVAPDDPTALAAALDSVLSNPAAFDRAGISARAVARFGLPAVGTQLQATYASVLSTGAGAKR